MMVPKFFYFDLGKVLVDFSHENMCRQMADAAGIDPACVREVLFSNRLQWEYEAGRVSSRQFYESFCRATGACPNYEALALAANNIFAIRPSMLPVVGQLRAAGYRLGILSNTCEGHWEYCLARYTILREIFSVYALSYEIRVRKPDAAIFLKAAEMAGCRPEEIFYTDDMASNVAGAKAAGFDAVVYTSAAELMTELRRRGVRFNY